jgi:riboflavin synthase
VFTGLVEERGRVAGRDGSRLRIAAELVVEDAKVGDSVAVNGCCLTVVDLGPGELAFDVVDESYARTTLGALAEGDPVNLERPVRPTDRLGGHIVQGHVDAVGEVVTPAPDLYVRTDPALLRYVVEKGSIAVEGVSLTVSAVDSEAFEVSLIPETLERTTLGAAEPGRTLNLEVDVLAKYVEKLKT